VFLLTSAPASPRKGFGPRAFQRNPHGVVGFHRAVIKNGSAGSAQPRTAVERITASNDTGNYVFSDVTPGPYTLNGECAEFRTKQVSELSWR